MIKLAALLLLAACGTEEAIPCPETIWGAAIEPAAACLPAIQVWTRENAIFDSAYPCSYAVLGTAGAEPCAVVQELLVACSLPDGYSTAAYHVSIDYEAGGYVWDGAIRAPSGTMWCLQDGGGQLTAVP